MENNKKINIKFIIGAIALVCVLVLVFFLGRITSNNPNDNNSSSNKTVAKNDNKQSKDSKENKKENIVGKYYKNISLIDSNSNVTVFKGIVPDGWTASVSSNYQVISPDFPVLESVTITSPDGKANIYIDSQQQYCESPTMMEGANEEYYTTYLHYMNASDFIQYYMDYAHPGSSLIKTLENDNEILSQANQYQQLKIQRLKNNIATITGGVNASYNYNVSGGATTMSKKQYQTANSYLEGSCVIVPITMTIGSSYYDLTNTYWEIPYSIVFEASDKDSFDKYYDDYNFIIANSQFTSDCYALVEYVANYIMNIKSAQAAAKSQASLDAMNNYIDSNYSSTSSASTNEKVMQMWDDYINEVDSYNTLDGGTIKTSMYSDVVAQNGDEIFIGSSTSDIPYGFTELSKSY